MSVLIKGVELPKQDDEYVIFTVYGDGGVVYGPLNRPHVRYKNRAVPVPPHGDLIDREPFVQFIKTHWDSYDQWFVEQLESRPTIIPADPAEEE